MKLYNVLNTSHEQTTPNGTSWLEALEKELRIKLPRYKGDEEMVGGHMSSWSGRSDTWNTEYIAYIPKSFNNNQNNYEYIEIPNGYYARYEDVKKW